MCAHKLDTDMAVPTNLDAVSEYYKNNLKHIMRKDSLTSSSETISSTNSVESNNKIGNATQNEISLQDRSHHLLSSSDMPLSYMHDDILYKQPSNINSIDVSGSSEVQFGHRIHYNGPVNIKQQIVVRDEEGAKKSYVNRGFQEPRTNNRSDEENVKNSENSKKDENFIKTLVIKHWKKITFLFFALCLILMSIFWVLYYFKTHPPDIFIISRKDWNATEPLKNLEKFTSKVDRFIIAHTVTPECLTKVQCKEAIRRIQIMHMDINTFKFDDIGYNFLIGGDGNVYEGRGWDTVGAHTAGYNRLSIGVAYIGDFTNKTPNEKQLSAGFSLFYKGATLEKVIEDYKIYGARQFRKTESPGHAFYPLIQKWDHWSDEI